MKTGDKTRRLSLLFGILLLLAGCGPSEDPLLSELKGRWAPEKGVKARFMASANTPRTAAPPSLKDICETEYVTFDKRALTPQHSGAVTLHRNGKREIAYMVAAVRREGSRIVLMGQEPNHPLTGGGETRLELLIRNGEIAFDDIVDPRGRSVRYDRFNNEQATRIGVNTVGDVMRLMFDLKPCAA